MTLVPKNGTARDAAQTAWTAERASHRPPRAVGPTARVGKHRSSPREQ